MRNKRILYLVFAILGFLLPTGAQADHRHRHDRHGGYISIYGNGWYLNYGQPPFYQTFSPPPMYYQAPPVIYVQPKQQVLVCEPTIYHKQTPSGLVAYQNCWMEWR